MHDTSLLGAGRDRAQWSAYGFIAGILIGLVLGWLFHGVISAFFTFIIVAVVLAIFLLAYLFYRRTRQAIDEVRRPEPETVVRLDPGDPVDTTGYVIRERSEPRER